MSMLCPAVDQGPLAAPITKSRHESPQGSAVRKTKPVNALPTRPIIRVVLRPKRSQSRPATTANIPPKSSISPRRYPVNHGGRAKSASI